MKMGSGAEKTTMQHNFVSAAHTHRNTHTRTHKSTRTHTRTLKHAHTHTHMHTHTHTHSLKERERENERGKHNTDTRSSASRSCYYTQTRAHALVTIHTLMLLHSLSRTLPSFLTDHPQTPTHALSLVLPPSHSHRLPASTEQFRFFSTSLLPPIPAPAPHPHDKSFAVTATEGSVTPSAARGCAVVGGNMMFVWVGQGSKDNCVCVCLHV